jgi:dTDP-4-amino-4,6-dideoxygalactose transaminase
MKIPFGNLKRQYEQLRDRIDTATREVYDSGWFILGQQVQGFEANFAQYCGGKYAVGVGFGYRSVTLIPHRLWRPTRG